MNPEYIVELANFYAFDYLRCMYTVLHDEKEKEYMVGRRDVKYIHFLIIRLLQILLKALLTIVNGSSYFNVSLLEKIISFHVVYNLFHQEIMLFGQLTAYLPGILVQLPNMIGIVHV